MMWQGFFIFPERRHLEDVSTNASLPEPLWEHAGIQLHSSWALLEVLCCSLPQTDGGNNQWALVFWSWGTNWILPEKLPIECIRWANKSFLIVSKFFCSLVALCMLFVVMMLFTITCIYKNSSWVICMAFPKLNKPKPVVWMAWLPSYLEFVLSLLCECEHSFGC